MRAILATLFFCALLPAAHAETTSFYGLESGRHTASGERFDPNAMTVVHRTLPFGTLVRVTYQAAPSWCAATIAGRSSKRVGAVAFSVAHRTDMDLAAHTFGVEKIRVAANRYCSKSLHVSGGPIGRVGLQNLGLEFLSTKWLVDKTSNARFLGLNDPLYRGIGSHHDER